MVSVFVFVWAKRDLTGDGDATSLESEGDPFFNRQLGVGVVESSHDDELTQKHKTNISAK